MFYKIEEENIFPGWLSRRLALSSRVSNMKLECELAFNKEHNEILFSH